MSEPSLDEVMSRLDDLLKEVRRQGRAAVAAQAAAESCLEAVQANAREDREDEENHDDEKHSDVAADEGERWLRALIPVADSIDRIVRQAASASEPRPHPKRSLLDRLLDEPVDDRRAASLLEGLRVLKSQLEAAFGELGVTVDRKLGAPVEAERQRVVEVRAKRAYEQPGTVVEMVRPGYALGETTVREAEVVVTSGAPANKG